MIFVHELPVDNLFEMSSLCVFVCVFVCVCGGGGGAGCSNGGMTCQVVPEGNTI